MLLPASGHAAETSTGPDPAFSAKPQADTSETGWACTVETLIADAFCAFEPDAGQAKDAAKQRAENQAAVGDIARRACASAALLAGEAQPEKVLSDLCNHDLRVVAAACTDDGRMALVDSEGHFAGSAEECYLAMAEVLKKTRLMASISVQCCQCLAGAGCGGPTDRCNRALTSPTPRLPACTPPACEAACSYFSEPYSELEPEPRAPPPPCQRPVAI
jgi:hypothetical protein